MEGGTNIFYEKYLAPFLEQNTSQNIFLPTIPRSISRMDLSDGKRSQYFKQKFLVQYLERTLATEVRACILNDSLTPFLQQTIAMEGGANIFYN